jgi:hypothetical protein
MSSSPSLGSLEPWDDDDLPGLLITADNTGGLNIDVYDNNADDHSSDDDLAGFDSPPALPHHHDDNSAEAHSWGFDGAALENE